MEFLLEKNQESQVPFSVKVNLIIGGNWNFFGISLILMLGGSVLHIIINRNFEPIFAPVLFISIFFLGVSLFVKGLTQAFRILHILKHGFLAYGRLTNSEQTSVKIGNKILMKKTYRYLDTYGVEHQVKGYIGIYQFSLDNEKHESVKVMYLQQDPNQSIILNFLPGLPSVDLFGSVGTVSIYKNIFIYLGLIVITLINWFS